VDSRRAANSFSGRKPQTSSLPSGRCEAAVTGEDPKKAKKERSSGEGGGVKGVKDKKDSRERKFGRG